MLNPRLIPVLQLGLFLALSASLVPAKPVFADDSKWVAPVVGSKLIRPYLQSQTPYGAGHRGVDYSVELGQGVFAPASGSIRFIGKVVDRNVVSIEHSGNLVSAFEPVCSHLRPGEKISVGDLIGEVCKPDDGYQQHCDERLCLHFSARYLGDYLSPLWLTGELSSARLLPWIEP